MKVNIKHPITEAEHVYLSMLIWHDIYKNSYRNKYDGKYINIIRSMKGQCPLCDIYNKSSKSCANNTCCLIGYDPILANNKYNEEKDGYICSLYGNWVCAKDFNKYAKEIFLRCRDRFYDLQDIHDKGELSYK